MAVSRKNPFPGMNPWLEGRWSDVHVAMIGFIRETLGLRLPDGLVAHGEEHISVTYSDGQSKRYRTDVALRVRDDPSDEPPGDWQAGLPPLWKSDGEDSGGVEVAEPKIVFQEGEPWRWVEIRDENGELITVIEVLSPANKVHNRNDYRAKRADYFAGGVSVVEIDLLRGGRHTVAAKAAVFSPESAYTVCVTRGSRSNRHEIYECTLRERLPVIRLPLRRGEPDLALDLQALIDRAYETGRYWTLDYSREPQPPLSEEDAEWARQHLLAAGLASE